MEDSAKTTELSQEPTPAPRRRRILLGVFVLLCAAVIWFIPPVYRLDGGSVEVQHWHRTKGEITLTVGPGSPTWISYDRISKHALNAIVVAEDARFYQHGGLDFVEIQKSIETNLRRGRYARGASTITQQVIKVALLHPGKNLVRKAREAVGAMLLELFLDKQAILEWYINLVQFGDGVYGVKEGCWHYFKTKPEQLTIEQAAHLALVLPSPNKWSAGLRRRNLTEFGHKRFAYIVKQMWRGGYITETQWQHAMATGNFGGPIVGYDPDYGKEPTEPDCAGEPECSGEEPDIWDEERDDLSFPKEEDLPFAKQAEPTPTDAPAEGELAAPEATPSEGDPFADIPEEAAELPEESAP